MTDIADLVKRLREAAECGDAKCGFCGPKIEAATRLERIAAAWAAWFAFKRMPMTQDDIRAEGELWEALCRAIEGHEP